jgi:hypothetical protein
MSIERSAPSYYGIFWPGEFDQELPQQMLKEQRMMGKQRGGVHVFLLYVGNVDEPLQ